MTKLMTLLLIFLFACSVAFAEDSPDENTVQPDKKSYGIAANARLSGLGVTPEISVICKHLELGVCATILRGTDSYTDKKSVGGAFSGSVGYVQHPFTRGWQNAFGVSYLWLSEQYIASSIFTDFFLEELDADSNETRTSGHIVSVYYRGCIKLNEHLGLHFQTSIPLYIGVLGSASEHILFIDNNIGFLWFLESIITTGVGVRFEW